MRAASMSDSYFYYFPPNPQETCSVPSTVWHSVSKHSPLSQMGFDFNPSLTIHCFFALGQIVCFPDLILLFKCVDNDRSHLGGCCNPSMCIKHLAHCLGYHKGLIVIFFIILLLLCYKYCQQIIIELMNKVTLTPVVVVSGRKGSDVPPANSFISKPGVVMCAWQALVNKKLCAVFSLE